MIATRRHRQSGFTLIEVVVAFALLALALTFLLGSLSGATRQVRNADDAGRATLHAQSLMAQLGVAEALRPGVRSGRLENGRYRWTLRMSPYVDPARPRLQPQGGAPRLLQVDLRIDWGDKPGQRLQWTTLRLARDDLNDWGITQ